MKRILIFLILLVPVYSFALQTGIENALDGGARPVSFTLDTRTTILPNVSYKSYERALTSNYTINAYSSLGRYASKANFINDGATYNITIAFSVDGTNYGDTITVKPTERISFDNWILFKSIQLGYSTATTNYRLMVR